MNWRLYLNLGNTTVQWAARRAGEWTAHGRLGLVPSGPAANMSEKLQAKLADTGLEDADCDGITACSSNPQADQYCAELEQRFSIRPRLAGQDSAVTVPTEYYKPTQLGIDRVLNVCGALALYVPPLVIVDLGTCITTELVTADGVLAGGAVAAGKPVLLAGIAAAVPHLLEALCEAQTYDATGPETIGPAGRSTAEGLAYGLYTQLAATAEWLAEDGVAFLDGAQVVLTGGDAQKVASKMSVEVTVNPLLALEGLRVMDNYA